MATTLDPVAWSSFCIVRERSHGPDLVLDRIQLCLHGVEGIMGQCFCIVDERSRGLDLALDRTESRSGGTGLHMRTEAVQGFMPACFTAGDTWSCSRTHGLHT